MSTHYYYLISSLITIDFDQYDAVPIEDILSKIEYNLSKKDQQYLVYLRWQIDLLNLEMITRGEEVFLPYGNYSKEILLQKEEKGGIPQLWQEYLHNSQSGAPLHIEYLWYKYYWWGMEKKNSFIRCWAQNELALRLSLVLTRKERTHMDTSYLELFQGELIEEILSGGKMIDFGIGYRFDWAAHLREILKEDNPLYSERSIDRIRWQFIDQQIASSQFTSNVVLGYIVKLLIIAKWQRVNHAKGKVMLRQIVGGD
ncbi:MAG: DUF2764 family protein [bacterium]